MKCLEASFCLQEVLEVTAAKICATAAKLNAAGTKLQLLKVTTAESLQLLKDKDCLKIKITYELRNAIYIQVGSTNTSRQPILHTLVNGTTDGSSQSSKIPWRLEAIHNYTSKAAAKDPPPPS
ncbi:hypothetical protein Tco_1307446, partial [Tanacetum coccineum]